MTIVEPPDPEASDQPDPRGDSDEQRPIIVPIPAYCGNDSRPFRMGSTADRILGNRPAQF